MKMKKLNLIGIMAILLLTSLVSAATLTRTAPSTATPGQSISITYTASGVTGKWFAAWEDTISCNSQVVRAFLSSDLDLGATTKTVSFTAPSSGSCTLTGFYQFNNGTQTTFPTLTMNVCVPATCASLGKQCGSYSDTCGGTAICSCSTGKTCSNGACITCDTCASLGKQCGTVTGNCGSLTCGSCSAGQQCSTAGQCLTCKTSADTNCDNSVTFQELNAYAIKWVNGQVTFTDLIQAASAWSS